MSVKSSVITSLIGMFLERIGIFLDVVKKIWLLNI